MSKALAEDVCDGIKELIRHVSGFDTGSEGFDCVFKHFTTKLRRCDTMYFLNKRDVDSSMQGMREKFCFHGFFREAEALVQVYSEYIPEDLPKALQTSRLNVVKFLLCMSETPTKKFLENPQDYVQPVDKQENDEIDWTEYLNEGIEIWNPDHDNESEGEVEDCSDYSKSPVVSGNIQLPTIRSTERKCVLDLRSSRDELLATIQHSWYEENFFRDKPESEHREANIALIWEDFLRHLVEGFVVVENPSIITEYKVIREVLWEMWGYHTCSTFKLCGNYVQPNEHITVASVRCPAFSLFMLEFIPHMKLMEYFREFEDSLGELYGSGMVVCHTYRSYARVINDITRPVYQKLCQLEDKVRDQEVTYTLLNLANDLPHIMEPLRRAKSIHQQVVLNFKTETPMKCATTLICRLHEGLNLSVDKLDQDLRTALFLGACRYYLGVIDGWLMKDDLSDYTGEFVIEKTANASRHAVDFVLKSGIDDECGANGILRIICGRVLQIGKNINFLRLLGKYSIIGESRDTIYQEFVESVLSKLRNFFNIIEDEGFEEDAVPLSSPQVSPQRENDIFNKDMNSLEDLVDTTNGFLMCAFAEFFEEQPPKRVQERPSLCDRVAGATTNLFPKTNFFETVLTDILDKRFTVSGLLVKNILLEEHLLEKQLMLFRHLYLFWDDMIFPFYRELFGRELSQTKSSSKGWANNVWLTSHLQDIFVDIYPEFYDRCSVQIKNGELFCPDSLSICEFVNINFDVSWPLNVIVNAEQIRMYSDIFRFLLKLKWALHSVSHLALKDLQPKTNRTSRSGGVASKLHHLKFCLVNVLNSLQHFLFGFVFAKALSKFELDLEKACDLESLIACHAAFIDSLHSTVADVTRRAIDPDKLNNVLICVKQLKMMWNNPGTATLNKIDECKKTYNSFRKLINPILFPPYLYDY